MNSYRSLTAAAILFSVVCATGILIGGVVSVFGVIGLACAVVLFSASVTLLVEDILKEKRHRKQIEARYEYFFTAFPVEWKEVTKVYPNNWETLFKENKNARMD